MKRVDSSPLIKDPYVSEIRTDDYVIWKDAKTHSIMIFAMTDANYKKALASIPGTYAITPLKAYILQPLSSPEGK